MESGLDRLEKAMDRLEKPMDRLEKAMEAYHTQMRAGFESIIQILTSKNSSSMLAISAPTTFQPIAPITPLAVEQQTIVVPCVTTPTTFISCTTLRTSTPKVLPPVLVPLPSPASAAPLPPPRFAAEPKVSTNPLPPLLPMFLPLQHLDPESSFHRSAPTVFLLGFPLPFLLPPALPRYTIPLWIFWFYTLPHVIKHEHAPPWMISTPALRTRLFGQWCN